MPRINIATSTLISALVLLSTASEAAAPANRDERIMRAVEKVVAEYRIYATCNALMPVGLQLAYETWDKEVRDGANALREIDASFALLARYTIAVAPSQLLDPTLRLSDAIKYCKANQAQLEKFDLYEAPRLGSAIKQVSSENRK